MLEMEAYLIGKAPFPHGKAWLFKCDVCGKTYEYGEPGEPLCSGPSESRDDHEQAPMKLVSVRSARDDNVVKYAPPGVAEARLDGPLYVPGNGLGDLPEEE